MMYDITALVDRTNHFKTELQAVLLSFPLDISLLLTAFLSLVFFLSLFHFMCVCVFGAFSRVLSLSLSLSRKLATCRQRRKKLFSKWISFRLEINDFYNANEHKF